MKVVLVNLHRTKTKQMPPLGLMYLVASLKSVNGLQAKLLDEGIDPCSSSVESVALHIVAEDPDILCFTSSTEQHQLLAKTITLCRRISNRRIGIIVGGAHATLATESCARTLGADVVFRGPGEQLLHSVSTLLYNQIGRTGVPGDECRIVENHVEKPDDLALPAFLPDRRCVNLEEYTHPFTIITARGCTGRCTFCSSPAINNGQVHKRSIDSIMKEITSLKEEFKAGKIAVLDDSFTHSPSRLRAICKYLGENNIKWFCESRLDGVDYNKLRMMHEAGCSEIQFGIECFEQETLDRIGKNIRSEDIVKVLGQASNMGICVAISLMIGLPGDSIKLVKRRIDQAVVLAEIGVRVIEFGFLRPFPGTGVYLRSEELGYGNVSNWWERDHEPPLCFPTTVMTRTELVGMMMYATHKVQETLGNSGQSDERIVMPAEVTK